jgi:hypothetical protein
MLRSKRRPAAHAGLSALALALGLVLTACLPEATSREPAPPDVAPADGKGGESLDTLGRDLVRVYGEYRAFMATSGAREQAFVPSDPALLVADGRVAVDATASGDPALLERALEALGLVEASRFGPVVSGHLPISALPEAAALSSLRRMVAAKAGTR